MRTQAICRMRNKAMDLWGKKNEDGKLILPKQLNDQYKDTFTTDEGLFYSVVRTGYGALNVDDKDGKFVLVYFN